MRGSDATAVSLSKSPGVEAAQVYRHSRRSASTAGDVKLYALLDSICKVARLVDESTMRVNVGDLGVTTLRRDDGAYLIVAHQRHHPIVKSVNRLLRRRMAMLSPLDPPVERDPTLTTSCFTGAR
jgi:hypothetical protein